MGASGALAERVIPLLASHYEIVGVTHTSRTLANSMSRLYNGDLLSSHEELFNDIFTAHKIDAVIWNPVRYFPMPLLESSRTILHTEFDLACALPLECVKSAMRHGWGTKGVSSGKTFVLITSLLAFGHKPHWGSYAIAKRAEVVLGEYLEKELAPYGITMKTIALGEVPKISPPFLLEQLTRAIENADTTTQLYKIDGDTLR